MKESGRANSRGGVFRHDRA